MKISPHKRGGFYTTITINGDKQWIYGSTPDEVDRKYTDLKYKYHQGYNVTSNPSMEEYMITWYQSFKAGEGALKTQEMYRNCINNHINPLLGTKRVKEITATQVQNLIKNITSSKSLAHQVRITLNQIFKQAMSDHIIAFNPVSGTKIVAPNTPNRKCLSPEQRLLLLDILKGHRVFPIVYTILYTGMRMGECLALLLNDIDFDNKTIRITKATEYEHSKPLLKEPKSIRGYRLIPMSNELCEYLKIYLKKRKNKKLYLFPGHSGGPMGLTEVKSQWKKSKNLIAKWFKLHPDKSDIEFSLTFRLLRHTFCTGLYDAGIDEVSAAEIMGHDVNIMRQVYTHISGKRKKQTLVKLNNLYEDTALESKTQNEQ